MVVVSCMNINEIFLFIFLNFFQVSMHEEGEDVPEYSNDADAWLGGVADVPRQRDIQHDDLVGPHWQDHQDDA